MTPTSGEFWVARDADGTERLFIHRPYRNLNRNWASSGRWHEFSVYDAKNIGLPIPAPGEMHPRKVRITVEEIE